MVFKPYIFSVRRILALPYSQVIALLKIVDLFSKTVTNSGAVTVN